MIRSHTSNLISFIEATVKFYVLDRPAAPRCAVLSRDMRFHIKENTNARPQTFLIISYDFFKRIRARPSLWNNTRINNEFLCCLFVFKMAGGLRDDTRAICAGAPRPFVIFRFQEKTNDLFYPKQYLFVWTMIIKGCIISEYRTDVTCHFCTVCGLLLGERLFM